MSNILFKNPDILTNIVQFQARPLTNVNQSFREAVLINMSLRYPYWNINTNECPEMEDLIYLYVRYAALTGDWGAFQLLVSKHHENYLMLQDAFKLALQSNREDLARWIYDNYILPVILNPDESYDFETEENIIHMLDNPINRNNMMNIIDRIRVGDLENGNIPANVRQFISVNPDAYDALAEHLYLRYQLEGDAPALVLQDYADTEVQGGASQIAIANPYDPVTAYVAHERGVRLHQLLSGGVPLTPSVYRSIINLLHNATNVQLPSDPLYALLFPEYAYYEDDYEPRDDVDDIVYAIVAGVDLPTLDCSKLE